MVDVPEGFHHHHHPDPDPDIFHSHGIDTDTPHQFQAYHHHHHQPPPATRLPALAPAPTTGPPPRPTTTPGIPPSTSPSASAEHLRQCQWNDNIRKKYRTKLSKQFERLQALVVVAGEQDQEGPGELRRDGRSTVRNGMGGVNKARVLDLARRRIEGLVREREELRRERERLVGLVEERGVGRWRGEGVRG